MAQQRSIFVAMGCGLCLMFATVNPAAASPIAAGFDLLQTLPTTFIDFSIQPIPAGFFGPGSDPFIGSVNFRGEPLNPAGAPAGTGNADTIVQRLSGDPLPVGGDATVPIQIVALSLKSLVPITVTYNGGQTPEAWSINITLPVGPSQPVGGLHVNHEVPAGGTDGGTGDSELPLICQALFQRLIPNPPPPVQVPIQLLMDIGIGTWQHNPGPLDQHSNAQPAGAFFIGGLDGGLFINNGTVQIGEYHSVAATPEPASAMILLVGAAGMMMRRRTR